MTIPSFVNVGAFGSGNGAITVGVPTGYVEGDLLLLLIESANETIATPNGWTQVTNSPQGTGTAGAAGGVRLAVFYKYATAGEADLSVADSGNHTTGIMAAFHGVDALTPIHQSAGQTQAATTGVQFPSVTTTEADCLIVLAMANDYDGNSTNMLSGWTNVNLASLTEQFDQTVSTQTGGGLALATGERAATGAIGTTTATNGASVANATMTIALKAAPPGISGSASITEAADTASATGSVLISGTCSSTEATDTLAATGSMVVRGTATPTEADDGLGATGSALVAGTLSATEGADTLGATGLVENPGRTGSLSITEADDALSATGSMQIRATATPTEDADTLSATGSMAVSGGLAQTEADDALSATGSMVAYAVLSATEADDSFEGVASTIAHADLSATEEADNISALADVIVLGSLSATDDADGVSSAGRVETLPQSANADIVEDTDTLLSEVTILTAGGLSCTEAPDTLFAHEVEPPPTYGSGACSEEAVAAKWEIIDLIHRICEEQLGIVIEDLTDKELVELARLVVGLFEKENM